MQKLLAKNMLTSARRRIGAHRVRSVALEAVISCRRRRKRRKCSKVPKRSMGRWRRPGGQFRRIKRTMLSRMMRRPPCHRLR
ncbi:hypothetical protein KCP75_25570 [Salmonella enterica subsp. enterica]|nr:hypothetical protein KCP75_25570 [Salmonella enterica subsp. enterica]